MLQNISVWGCLTALQNCKGERAKSQLSIEAFSSTSDIQFKHKTQLDVGYEYSKAMNMVPVLH